MTSPAADRDVQAVPLVSVVMPTRNRAALLERALSSVTAQTVTDWELIVVDDASVDATPRLLAGAAAEDERIRTIRNDTAAGAAAARNRAIACARGRWVAFIDDDCEWLPDKLGRQLAAASADAVAGVVYSPYVERAADGSERVVGAVDVTGAGTLRSLIRNNVIGTPAALVDRRLLVRCGGFDERLPRLQDWDLWVRLASMTEFAYVPEPLVRTAAGPGISSSSEALVQACLTLGAKFSSEIGLRPGELADWRYALGHLLMMHGAPDAGRRFIWSSLAVRPWPPRRCLMGVLAAMGAGAYAYGAAADAALKSWRGRHTRRTGGA